MRIFQEIYSGKQVNLAYLFYELKLPVIVAVY
jgi:ethanolamine utilization microcompartment shell protein EutS